jgi:hypothetical protein
MPNESSGPTSPRFQARLAEMLGRDPKGPGAFTHPDVPLQSGRSDEWVEIVDKTEPAAPPISTAEPSKAPAPASPAAAAPARSRPSLRRVVRRADLDTARAQGGEQTPVSAVPAGKGGVTEGGDSGNAPATQPSAGKRDGSDILGRSGASTGVGRPAEGTEGGNARPGQGGSEAAEQASQGGFMQGAGGLAVPVGVPGGGVDADARPVNRQTGVKRPAEHDLGDADQEVSPGALAKSMAGG